MQSKRAIKIETIPYRFVVLACLSLTINTNQLDAFWLTDGSLFQQPASSGIVASNRLAAPNDQTNQIGHTSQPNLDQPERSSKSASDVIGSRDFVATASGNNDIESKQPVDPWVLVQADATTSKSTVSLLVAKQNKQQESREANNFVTNAAAEATCQCNPDWLFNQTSLWMGRWLNSTNFANRIRAQVLASNSLAAAVPQAKMDQQQQQQHRSNRGTIGLGGSGSSRPGVAWNRQTSKRNSNTGQGSNHGPGDGKQAHHNRSGNHPSGKWKPAHTANNGQRNQNNNNNNNLQPSSASQTTTARLAKSELGFKNAGGDRMGPAGVIAVKDRGALFDLTSPSSKTTSDSMLPEQSGNNEKQQQSSGQASSKELSTKADAPRLVFVESEQMLVIETESGWRPIPMMAPLHDFRKTITKFSLIGSSSSLAEDNRNKLTVQLAGGRNRATTDENNLISLAIKPHIISRDRVSFLASLNSSLPVSNGRPLLNPIAKAIEAAGAKLNQLGDEDDFNLDDDGEDEEDEDDDEDDEEEDDDGEDDADDDENAGDDDNNIRTTNAINFKTGKTNKAGGSNNNNNVKIGSSHSADKGSGERTKRRRAQVSSRSALSTSSQADIVETGDNSLSPASPVSSKLETTASETDSNNDNGGVPNESLSSNAMKLRLIALNEPYSGNQHGLRGANFECKRNAAKAGIKGAFQAFLATSYQNLNEIVRHNSHVQKYPIVNMRGDILAASWHDLFKSPARTTNPLSRIYSFDGRHVATDPNWPNKLVWLGTGSKFGARDSSGHNCDGWHSDSLNKLGFASPLHPPRGNHNHHYHHHNHHQLDHIGSTRSRTQQRRFAANTSGGPVATSDDNKQTRGQNSTLTTSSTTSNLVFDVMEKYPCRMPLVVLCMETVAQGV